MVLAGFTLDGSTYRYVFARRSVIAVRHIDGILESYVRLVMGAVGSEFHLMDDNEKHIKLFSSMNFCKLWIFTEKICQLDIQIISVYSRDGH
ncbi:hypothetical protein TNCV_2952251 [Trichonephila clavipes]|nr:hypothetical protein TNCV_2952251 [Trichonephila clavipes]